MLQMILDHKPLVLDVNMPNLEEGEWLLAQLSKRGLCFNAQSDASVHKALPPGFPGSESWLLA